jgi:hypothetical protein
MQDWSAVHMGGVTMKDFIFVLLAILVFALIVVGVFLGLAGLEGNRDFICKKLFSRKKLKKPLNAKPYCAPLPPEKPKDDNLPHDIQCEVCGFKFIPYNSSRYIAVGKHNYGKFHYYNGGAIISDTAIVDGLHDAFDCPMCGCQIVVHPYLPVYEERQADTDAQTSEI